MTARRGKPGTVPATARGPDRSRALAQYRRRAAVYDWELALFEPVRRRAIARLAPRPGEVVLDAGCGTGLSLAALRRGVGPTGRVIGIEQSPEMIEQARQRVARHGWDNVTLLCAPVESADTAARADAVLFHFTHDVLRRPEAIARVLRQLAPGARVVATGLKWTGGWAAAANLLVLPAALRSVTSLEGLRAPWDRLQAAIGPMQVQTMLFGTVYIASGRVARRRAAGPAGARRKAMRQAAG